MWSGPRNISTAMMRAFGARADCAVTDEPFYAAYLVATGLDPPDARRGDRFAADRLARRSPTALRRPAAGRQAGLVPEAHDPPHAAGLRPRVDATASSTPSSSARPRRCSPPIRGSATTSRSTRSACRRRSSCSTAPPTGSAVRRRWSRARTCSPTRAACCRRSAPRCGDPFDPAMLAWPPGRRDTDGVWAPAWYAGGRAVDRLRARRAARPASTTCPTPSSRSPRRRGRSTTGSRAHKLAGARGCRSCERTTRKRMIAPAGLDARDRPGASRARRCRRLSCRFPAINPVLVQWGPLAIRWYALAYIAGPRRSAGG